MFGPFLAYFSLFGVKNIFFKKSGLVMHNNTWVPNTMLSSRKNQRANFNKTSRPKDRQILFAGPFWPIPGVQ